MTKIAEPQELLEMRKEVRIQELRLALSRLNIQHMELQLRLKRTEDDIKNVKEKIELENN